MCLSRLGLQTLNPWCVTVLRQKYGPGCSEDDRERQKRPEEVTTEMTIMEEELASTATKEPHIPVQRKRKRRMSLAIMGRLDVIHECELDHNGDEVWGAEYVAQSPTSQVHVAFTYEDCLIGFCRSSLWTYKMAYFTYKTLVYIQ